ncbi:hypothetical protein Cfor_08902 [Coptotermes formosanus]|uniref:Thioredoxin domain-containing protein n=1 Tax=Coptotermes formosanus TaxID=36987 RepID=A0A6L2QAV6_COPFO|nr:hypothetical protein Cfor_08902 [Coptotermes formosanus]
MRLGATIPNFSANTTQGPIKFYDWQGDSWCLLFSHPADFTPVCTTELGRIAVHDHEFKKREVKVIAHSCDKLKSHSDWVAVSGMLMPVSFIGVQSFHSFWSCVCA